MPFVGFATARGPDAKSRFDTFKEIVMSVIRFLSRTLAALTLAATTVSAWAAIDINKASTDQLQALKGIGPQLSARIIEARQKAAFKNWNDLIERVNGLGPAKAARLSTEGLTVAGAAFAATDSMLTAVAPARKSVAPPAAGGVKTAPLAGPVKAAAVPVKTSTTPLASPALSTSGAVKTPAGSSSAPATRPSATPAGR